MTRLQRKQTLKKLQKEAPHLRECHLKQRKKTAVAQGDEKKAQEIDEIIKREKKKKFL